MVVKSVSGSMSGNGGTGGMPLPPTGRTAFPPGLGYTNAGLSDSALSVRTETPTEPHGGLQGSNQLILTDVDDSNSSCCDQLRTAVSWAKERSRRFFTKKTLYKRVPILTWMPKYTTELAVGDLIAGITVGLTVIPQSLAYANIAGLPPQYGLYGSFLGAFIYIFFGSCKEVPMGPTAIASLMTYQAVTSKGLGPQHAVLLTFLCGVIELLMAILGLGFLIDFVSGPVSSGFTSAVALIILTSQMKDILGITVQGSTFLQQWVSIFKNIGETKPWDAALGVACIAVLLLIRVIGMVQVGPNEDALKSSRHRVANKLLWVFGATRNAFVVVLCGLIGFSFTYDGSEPPMRLIGYIPPGLPAVQPPAFSYVSGNQTFGFMDMVQDLGSGLLVVPLIALLENIAICKAFADGKAVDATQELLALGFSNIGSSFFQSYPCTGSVARAAVSRASGARTPFGGLYTGSLVILALLFFTPYFAYIPKAALAAVIIAAVVFMVEVHVVKPMWRAKKTDLVPGVGTFIFCLVLPLEVGILLGIGVNVVFILYHAARPKVSVETLTTRGGRQYLMLTPDRCLIFPSVDYVRRLVTKASLRHPQPKAPVVLDCTHIYGADYTAARAIHQLTSDFSQRGQPLFFYNLKSSVSATFESLGPADFVVFYELDALERLLKESASCEQEHASV